MLANSSRLSKLRTELCGYVGSAAGPIVGLYLTSECARVLLHPSDALGSASKMHGGSLVACCAVGQSAGC